MPPSAMPPSTVVSIAVKASVVATTNCSISRNQTISEAERSEAGDGDNQPKQSQIADLQIADQLQIAGSLIA